MPDNNSTNETDLDHLRNILLGSEKDKIKRIEQQLSDPERQIQAIGTVLPQAIRLSAKNNHKLTDELMPLVEEAIQVSVKRDITIFSDALYPVMGPAIRKSISETFTQMFQSINKAIEHSFSWQGLKWRIEAWRSGKSFAEIVLLHSLVYQVEQVFLIHKETGLLLHHTTLSDVVQQDADLISAMLTAIQDFVRDSFNDSLNKQAENDANQDIVASKKGANEHNLNQISMGEFSIWIEQGPDAVIAIVLRGNAPKSLRHELLATVESVQQQYSHAMRNFNGNIEVFNPVEEELRGCLQSQYHSEKKKTSWMTIGLIFCVVLLLTSWLFLAFEQSQRWHKYVQLLKSEPGIVLTDIAQQDGQYIVRGLLDPLAREPQEVLSASSLSHPLTLGSYAIELLNEADIVFYFEPYQSLTETFVQKRVIQLLEPPETVNVQIDNGVLTVSGKASPQWIAQLKQQSAYISGINQLKVYQLTPLIDLSHIERPKSVQLRVDNNTLIAAGHAPYEWVMSAKKTLTQIPGVNQYNDAQLQIDIDLSSLNAPQGVFFDYDNGLLTISGEATEQWIQKLPDNALAIPGVNTINRDKLHNSDRALLQQLKQDLEAESVYFNPGESHYSNTASEADLSRIIATIQLLSQQAQLLSIPLKIIVQGFSDSSGSFQTRLDISYLRAENFRQYLIARGINETLLLAKSMVSDNNIINNSLGQDESFNRRVDFLVTHSPE